MVKVHVLPKEMLGKSTFGLSMWLLKWLPMRVVDGLLLIVSRMMLGDTAKLGFERPQLGPLELKTVSGKTPVLDVGTLARIKSGDIKVLSITFHSFALSGSYVLDESLPLVTVSNNFIGCFSYPGPILFFLLKV